ncbi:50S ribosomal protein L29 [Pseudobdellovibrio exovorus]|uniref:Large ribosomal subunit protein uL29 n=1 Tax=Pseudobdellovibrio exovorus JSS TaxID=1184267 RepID=M4VSE5_9BACT|nr:50S ribosomal protein L29 [Pseudobdellovibrio exovorus]AGH96119.1 50S ribosomal protein L29 [Pseudobdellovibrio exovorus JSS]
MKFADIENKSVTELIKQKNELSAKLFEMKMKNSLGQLATPHQVRNVRRDIARINTAIVRKAAR